MSTVEMPEVFDRCHHLLFVQSGTQLSSRLVPVFDIERYFLVSYSPLPFIYIVKMMDYIRDIPVLLPHLASQFFSMNGLILMFRLRVVMCLAVAAIYILSPLDILPEAVFGLIGVLDDLFVVFLFAIYIALAYRRFIGGET